VPLPDGGKQWNLNGVRRVLYRLPEVKAAIAESRSVFVAEGEKDADALATAGVVATCNTEGAWQPGQTPKWRPEYTEQLRGAMAVAVTHKDDPGRARAQHILNELTGVAAHVRLVEPLEGKDAHDHLQAGWHVRDFVEVFDQLQAERDDLDEPSDDQTADEAVKEKFPRLDWHKLWADQTEQEWIHNPLLPARRLVAIYSAPKIGKSLLMLEMAVTLSRGEQFLGHTPSKRYRVLYVDYENDPLGDIRTRLQAMEYSPDDLDYLDYLSFPTMAALNSPQGAAELLAAVNAYGSEVVVIDTISRAIEGEENSNDTWLAFYLHTGLQLKQLGVAMIRLDHSGKDESKGMRGGSAKAGDVDAVWLLTRITDSSLRLECSFTRPQLDTKLLKVTRHSEPLRHELEDAGAITTPEAKIQQLIMLCDNDNLPPDANRDDVRTVAKRHGMKIATELIGEVVKRRKNAPSLLAPENEPEKFSDRSQEVSNPETNPENADRNAPVNPGQPT
jgi:AAA domain